jgi:hypothetical protein
VSLVTMTERVDIFLPFSGRLKMVNYSIVYFLHFITIKKYYVYLSF